jgi:deoxyadenosine/deoxycytidine kinase
MIAEIVGPSGAGKSTLSVRLNSPGTNIRAGITVWGMPFPLLIGSAIVSLPTLLMLWVERRRITAGDVKQVVRLTAFYHRLKRKVGVSERTDTALFLDEGVVFALAKLRADDLSRNESAVVGSMKRWEQKALDKWSEMINAIVWLDAPDDMLIERIRTRSKQHRMKHRPDREIYDFLKRYRASYEGIIDELRSRKKDLAVLRFQTDQASLDLMADKIVDLVHAADKTPVGGKNEFAN